MNKLYKYTNIIDINYKSKDENLVKLIENLDSRKETKQTKTLKNKKMAEI